MINIPLAAVMKIRPAMRAAPGTPVLGGPPLGL
jgi:hypothetical protein